MAAPQFPTGKKAPQKAPGKGGKPPFGGGAPQGKAPMKKGSGRKC